MKSLFYLLEVLTPFELEAAIASVTRPNDQVIIREIINAIRDQRSPSAKLHAELCSPNGYSSTLFRKRCSIIMSDVASSLSGGNYKKELLLLARRRELMPLFVSRTKHAIRTHKNDRQMYLLLSLSGYFYCIKYASKHKEYFASELKSAALNTTHSANEYIALIELMSLLVSGMLSKGHNNKQEIEQALLDIRKQVHDAYTRYEHTDDIFIRWFMLLSAIHYEIIFRIEGGIRQKLPLLHQTAIELESLELFESLTSYVKRIEALVNAREGHRMASYESLLSIIKDDPLSVICSPAILTDLLCEAIEVGNLDEVAAISAPYHISHISVVRSHALLNEVIIAIVTSNMRSIEVKQMIENIYQLNRKQAYRLKLDILIRLSETVAAVIFGEYSYARRLCTRHRKYFEKRGLLTSITDGIDWPSLTKVYSALDQFISLYITNAKVDSTIVLQTRIASLANTTSMIQIIERTLLSAILRSQQ